MCQYSADSDGKPTAWHQVHWETRAVGGVALVMSEATAISPEGRLTLHDLMLWNLDQAESFRIGTELVHRHGAKFGIQLGHCGRKSWPASKGHGEYRLVSSSGMAFDQGWKIPDALSVAEIKMLVEQFVTSASLAIQAGADVIEIHAAHGYLLHQFLSPLSNIRQDDYGGSLENRARFAVDVVRAVRNTVGVDIPVFVRLSCTDWAEPRGFVLSEAVDAARLLADAGADVVDCSSGGTLPVTSPPLREGYQLPFAEMIRREVKVITAGVGLLEHPDFCNEAIETGRCDLVMLGRELLRNPYWTLQAARHLAVPDVIPRQYLRAF